MVDSVMGINLKEVIDVLYILEGCDGSGKTTLARFLSKLLNAEIVHCNQYTPNDMLFFNNIASQARNKNIIADRFCYGQYVYQEEGDRPLGSITHLHTLETAMMSIGVRVILVSAPDEVIENRLELRGEHLINGLTVKEVKSKYEAVRKMSILTWVDYFTGEDEL